MRLAISQLGYIFNQLSAMSQQPRNGLEALTVLRHQMPIYAKWQHEITQAKWRAEITGETNVSTS